MKALVVGGDGFLGVHLVSVLQDAGLDVVRSSRRGEARAGVIFIDMAKTIPDLPAADVIFIVAAVQTFKACEGNQIAWIVNADAPVEIAQRAKWMDAFPVYVSSDAVEWSNSDYARAKAYAELGVLMVGGAVVRPGKISPERVSGLCQLLLRVGKGKMRGVHRWQ